MYMNTTKKHHPNHKSYQMLKLVVISLCFILVETLISFILLSFYSFDLYQNFSAAILWNFWRLLFHGLPYFIALYLFTKHINMNHKKIVIAIQIFNLLIYLLFSFASTSIWGNNVPLAPEGLLFWSTCISTFFSPLIAFKLGIFRVLNKYIKY